MAVPKSVQDQADKSDALQKEIYGSRDGKGDDKGDKGIPKKEAPKEPAKTPVKEPDPEPVVAVNPVIPDPSVVDWEQKYKVIEGKYKAEVPALQTQLSELREEVVKLKESGGSSNEDPKNFGEAVAKMTEQYGEEFTTFVNRVTEERATTIATKIVDERLKGMTDKVDSVVQNQVDTAETTFLRALDDGLAGWRVINKDPKFLAWLEKPIDPELGPDSYMDKLTTAYDAFNAQTVLTIFNRYVKESPETLADKKREAELEELATPDSSGGGNNELLLDDTKETYTGAEVEQFYRDCRTGKYDHDPAEKARIDADIITAGAEGRIT